MAHLESRGSIQGRGAGLHGPDILKGCLNPYVTLNPKPYLDPEKPYLLKPY